MILEGKSFASLYSGALALASRGTSATAQFAVNEKAESLKKLKNSNVFGIFSQKALENLDLIFRECRDSDWDGYSAEPVSEDSYELAIEFLKALPLGTETPSIGAEADGQITMEWYRNPNRVLSISISPQSELHYAALLRSRKAFGTEPFYGEVPESIMRLIYQVIEA